MMEANQKIDIDQKFFKNEFEKFIKNCRKYFGRIVKAKFDSLSLALVKKINRLEKLEASVNAKLKKMQETNDEFWDRMDAFEETFLNIYHSITKNQYLYAFEPEKVAQNIPKQYKKVLDKKIKEKNIEGYLPVELI